MKPADWNQMSMAEQGDAWAEMSPADRERLQRELNGEPAPEAKPTPPPMAKPAPAAVPAAEAKAPPGDAWPDGLFVVLFLGTLLLPLLGVLGLLALGGESARKRKQGLGLIVAALLGFVLGYVLLSQSGW